ncbi:hypothetical protein IFR05_005574 [Cadophora sp. M221]|nr:hypothetical protein IFR05_005574 [Cadophora sp. M221]
MSTPPVPNTNENTIRAGNLPVRQTATHIFFGYQGPDLEHYMMYCKALLFGDGVVAKKILAAKTPGEAKTLGRQAGSFDQKKWDGACDGVVERGNFLKFSQNPELKDILLGTGTKIIVEASPSDRIWGVGFDAENAEGREEEWGANKLGKALMRVRSTLQG